MEKIWPKWDVKASPRLDCDEKNGLLFLIFCVCFGQNDLAHCEPSINARRLFPEQGPGILKRSLTQSWPPPPAHAANGRPSLCETGGRGLRQHPLNPFSWFTAVICINFLNVICALFIQEKNWEKRNGINEEKLNTHVDIHTYIRTSIYIHLHTLTCMNVHSYAHEHTLLCKVRCLGNKKRMIIKQNTMKRGRCDALTTDFFCSTIFTFEFWRLLFFFCIFLLFVFFFCFCKRFWPLVMGLWMENSMSVLHRGQRMRKCHPSLSVTRADGARLSVWVLN